MSDSQSAKSTQAEVRRSDDRKWTTRSLLEWMSGYFQERAVESPRLVGEILLAHVLQCDRMRLYMEVDRPASADELSTLRGLVKRAGQHEPVQYLTGTQAFFSREFVVNSAVLIPRPSTESLVRRVLRLIEGWPSPRVADIGTGSGAIAITVALEHPGVQVIATDVSDDALQVAQENARHLGAEESVAFRRGNLFEALSESAASDAGLWDVVVSNPPYISDAEWKAVDRNVAEYEPTIALRGGADGLDYLRELIAHGHRYLNPGGWIVLEIAASQAEAVLDLALANAELTDPIVEPDHEDLPRMFIARRISHSD